MKCFTNFHAFTDLVVPLDLLGLVGTVTLQDAGLCPARDLQYITNPASVVGPTVGFPTLPGGTRLRTPFCIGLTMEVTTADTNPVLYFHQVAGEAPNGTLTVTGSGVTFNLFDATVNFPLTIPTGIAGVQLQICADGSTVTLYQDCSPVGGPSSFPVTEYFDAAGAAIGLFRGALAVGTPASFVS